MGLDWIVLFCIARRVLVSVLVLVLVFVLACMHDYSTYCTSYDYTTYLPVCSLAGLLLVHVCHRSVRRTPHLFLLYRLTSLQVLRLSCPVLIRL